MIASFTHIRDLDVVESSYSGIKYFRYGDKLLAVNSCDNSYIDLNDERVEVFSGEFTVIGRLHI